MANGQSPYNPMQANMGLFPQTAGPAMIPTPSPSDTSMRLMEQAAQRIASSHQTLQATPLLVAQAFGSQFQQRFQQAQGMQSFSPFQAQMMSGQGGSSSYLPSPLMMTPAQSGVFRPQMPSPMMPVPPMYTPPIISTPFQPQMPQSMFQTSWDQQARVSDLQSNRMFSYGMQTPGVAGQALGIGAGAMAGARLGGAFGPMGRLAGAVGGGFLAGKSGIAESIGNFAQLPFQPMVETRQMGSAIQRMSQDWLVTGSQLHATGQGLSQQASMGLAGGIKDLSSDSGFRQQTGGMFNRQDLMKMTQLSGQSGLMDMAQSVPAIKDQLKQVAVTVKRFMELTSDSDVTNVIREMGQMRQFGMTMPQINQAAENMRLFSRAAGTSIAGMRQMSGLPGAMIYQGMGLTAGQGFDYGNYSLAMARQTVASGGVNPRQLALMGGVQGMAQRNMQAQAAFTSMPMFAAANAQYGSGGWEANQSPGGMGGGQGAFGMVNAAVSNLNRGVRQGGLEALVSFPLQQNEIADEASSRLTPMEQTAQRFRMAMETGKRFGLKGQGAFDMGARMLYGNEVANQMSIQSRDPGMWSAQQKMFDNRLQELSFEQRRQRESDYSTIGHVGERIASSAGGRELGKVGRGISGGFGKIGDVLGGAGTAVGDFFGPDTDDGIHRMRLGKGRGISEEAAGKLDAGTLSGFKFGYEKEGKGARISNRGMGAQLVESGEYAEGLALGGDLSAIWALGMLKGSVVFDSILGTNTEAGMYEVVGGAIAGVRGTSGAEMRKVAQSGREIKRRTIGDLARASKSAGDTGDLVQGASALQKALPKGVDSMSVIIGAGNRLASKAKDYALFRNKMSSRDTEIAVVESIAAGLGGDVTKALSVYQSLPEGEKQRIRVNAINMAETDPDVSKGGLLRVGAEEWKGDTLTRIGDITKEYQDKQEADLDSLELRLGFREKGILADADKYGLEDFKTKAKDQGVAKTVTMAALLGGGNQNNIAEAKKLFLKEGGKEKDWAEYQIKTQVEMSKLDSRSRDFLEGASKGKMSTLADWVTGSQKQGATGAIRSNVFGSKFAEFSSGLAESVGKGKGAEGVYDISSMLSKMTVEELTTMSKSSGATGQMGKLGLRAKAGDQAALTALTQAAGKVGGAELTDTALNAPTGAEAQAAEKSSEAAGEMALVAQDLAPAAKDLRAAAKMLLDKALIDQQMETAAH